MAEVTTLQRAGFWRRLGSAAIDIIVIAILLQLLTMVLFPLSGGRIQGSGVVSATACEELSGIPAGITLRAGFQPDKSGICERNWLGVTLSRSAIFVQRTTQGVLTTTTTYAYPLNSQGAAVHALYTDWLGWPVWLLLRWWLDSRGRSFSRKIMRIRLSSAVLPDSTPPDRAVTKRYLVFALPFTLAWVFQICAGLFPEYLLDGPSAYWTWTVGPGLLTLIAALAAAGSMIRKRDTFYDRPAGTCVRKVIPAAAEVVSS